MPAASGGRPRPPAPASASPDRALWPWAFPTGSRHVPVVGPTEALRGRDGGPGMAAPAGAVSLLSGPAQPGSAQPGSAQPGSAQPGSAQPGSAQPGPAQRSSWQLALEVWEQSGVIWERPAPAAALDPTATWLPEPGPLNVEQLTPGPVNPGRVNAAPGARRLTVPEPAAAQAPASPADPRLAEATPADAGPSADGPAAVVGTGPAFADSGVVPQPEFPARRSPRRPEFSPADDLWAAAQRAGRDDTVPRGHAQPPSSRPDPARPDPAQPRQRPEPTWTAYPPAGSSDQQWPADTGQVPLGAPVTLDLAAPEYPNLAAEYPDLAAEYGDLAESYLTAEPDGAATGWADGAAPGEPDELFRAWQGSVDQAVRGRGPWSGPRRGGSAPRRRRALQAAAIGVPVAVIVTVGAGALMMLTGKANEMLAVRSDNSSPSPAATATGAASARASARAGGGGVPPAFLSATLSGYPGQHGSATVASMMAAAGLTVAVGTADGHPAIWRRGATGSWTLESTASLGQLSGGLGLASVAHGPDGWIAVGTAADGRATTPVVLASADGVRWQPVTALTGRAGTGTLFLGAAAGHAGYVVVGRQMAGGRAFAVLWHSADLRSWTADANGGLDGRLSSSTVNAVTATASGFVAVGSHGAFQSIWVSADGRNWQLDYKSPPAGASSATLRTVAASGALVVAGGYAASKAGDIPVIVVSADGGGHWRQIVLPTPNGFGVITALTATPAGFTAAGLVARDGAQHPVTWTTPDGATWSGPTQAPGAEITALTAVGTTVTGASEQGNAPTLIPLAAP